MQTRGTMRDFYCFLHDGANGYYSASYDALGNPVISVDNYPNQQPLKDNPANLRDTQIIFGTNKTYFSGVRSVAINWNFVGDGAQIVRSIKYSGLGYAAELYILIIRYDDSIGIYKKYYEGRLDFSKGKDLQSGYSVPCIDLSCWGMLAQNESVRYQINCTSQNPKAIPILFDGTTLQTRITYQTVPGDTQIGFSDQTKYRIFATVPIVIVNTDGDSFGLITENQELLSQSVPKDFPNPPTIFSFVENNDIFFVKGARQIQVNIIATVTFQVAFEHTTGNYWGATFNFTLTSQDNNQIPIQVVNTTVQDRDKWYTYSFTINNIVDIAEGQSWALVCELSNFRYWVDSGGNPYSAQIHIQYPLTNIIMTAKSAADPTIVYGLRPLDVLQNIVSRATNNQYTANSNYFTQNHNIVLTCGNALRNAPNAYIVSSFADFFKSYNSISWLAFRIINNQIWIEPAEVIYDDSTNLFSLGEVKNFELDDATDYLINELEVGSPKQDYRHTSGRLEFNSTNTFSVYQYNIRNKLSLVSTYRKDSYGMEFIRLDYAQQSTQDNTGDDAVFMIDITDTTGSAGVEVENFINYEVDATPLAPLIYYPFNNDTITNDKPIIRGACQPNTTFNIYVDGSFDGTSTSDNNGFYNYNIQTSLSAYDPLGTATGVHTIDVTFTDETGTLNSVTVTINSGTTNPAFEYPKPNDNLYNNKPILTGFLQAGTSMQLYMDGNILTTVHGDGNCRWSYQYPILMPLSNAQHVATLGNTFVSFSVDSFTAIPLITTNRFGFISVDNLPLIEGVAAPGTKVNLYLDYVQDNAMGTAYPDQHGNWAIQIPPHLHDTSGMVAVEITPLSNGSHIFSTDLTIQSTPIATYGYKINRPAYDSLTGVIDNSVYNTQITPMHCILNRMNFWKSIFYQQPATVIKFETGDKNQSFSTTLNGVTVKENDSVPIANYSGTPLFIPYLISFQTETPFSFVDTIDNFNSGGLVELSYQGNLIYGLPIGKMTVEDVTRDIQKWQLLVSAKTPLSTLANLSNLGSTFTLMANTIYHSDYNTLHFVMYNYSAPDQFDNQADIYQDWFMNRNNRWVNNPDYLQKVQTSDIIVDQVIINQLTGSIQLDLMRCSDGTFVQSFPYNAVSPSPIPPPDIVLQATINFNQIPEDEYFFVIVAGGQPCAISERISVKKRWYGTILIDSGNSRNKTGAIFSAGWRPAIRVEGLVEKYVGSIESITNEDEVGNFDMLHSISTRKRTILFGAATGIPDYLYLKIVSCIILDDLKIQGINYTIAKNTKIEPVDKIAGYPMYYYSVDFDLTQDSNGFAFAGGTSGVSQNVVLVVDAGAFGVGGSQLTNIELD